MPFATTWMDLGCHTEWSQAGREMQISYDITYVWILKKGTKELIYRIEIDPQMEKTNLWLPEGRVGEE